MKTESGELTASGKTKSVRKGWPISRWLLLIVIVLAAHVALIFTFGTRKPIPPRPVTDVPQLVLAGGLGEWMELNDPTLFALPNREGFAGPAWIKPPPLHVHMMDWTEPPRWLYLTNTLPASGLGAIFTRFMQTNRFAGFQFQFKAPAQTTVPVVPMEPLFAQTSVLRVEGTLTNRSMLTSTNLPAVACSDTLEPTVIEVLVNTSGRVISTVLLRSCRYDVADQQALELARRMKFAPAPNITVGKLIFDWCTVAPQATNSVPVL